MSKTKRNSLILLLIVGALALTLAMSVRGVTLSSGQPFSLGMTAPDSLESTGLSSDTNLPRWILRAILALLLILFPVYFIYALFTPEGRRQLAVGVVLMAAIFLLAGLVRTHIETVPLPTTPPQMPSGPEQLPEVGPVASFPVTPPSWLTLVVTLGISLLVVAAIFVVLRFAQRGAVTPASSLDTLANEARTALESLYTGGDLKLAIIHCYQEMSRVVKEEKKITRGTAMTPREFEEYLISNKLPPESIRKLTRLFEQVRYGSLPVGAQEEKTAVACLTEIVNACTGAEHGYANK
jgi:hypothetical protein